MTLRLNAGDEERGPWAGIHGRTVLVLLCFHQVIRGQALSKPFHDSTELRFAVKTPVKTRNLDHMHSLGGEVTP